MQQKQMAQACRPSMNIASINLIQRAMHGACLNHFGRKDGVTGEGLRVQFLSLMQTSSVVLDNLDKSAGVQIQVIWK